MKKMTFEQMSNLEGGSIDATCQAYAAGLAYENELIPGSNTWYIFTNF